MKQAIWKCKLAFALAVLGVSAAVSAQPYPNKPVQLVHGFPPGTVVDAVSRVVSVEMAKRLGQPVVLDFRPGANGSIGGRYVVNAKPDGYTLYYGNSTSFHPLFVLDNSIYVATDFSPVSNVVVVPYFVFSSAKIPVNSFKELVAFSKGGSDTAKYGATSQTMDLIMQMLKDRNGLNSRGIPYKSTVQIVTALLVDEVDFTIGAIQPFVPHIKAGTIRTLFVASRKRSPLLPDVPTSAEVGIPNFEVSVNFGLWAPAHTSADIRQKLSTVAAAAVKVPSVVEQIRIVGAEPVGSSPEEQLRTFESDTKFWTEAARLSNFKPQ